MPSSPRHPFEARLLHIKSRTRPEPFDWYRFDTLANITHLNALLPKGLNSVLELAGGEPVADFGAGDGDMAFLLESLGCQVTAMDWPGTNANQMNGLALLKRELGSEIAIREVEFDRQFRLDGERFGLSLAFGLLYHLKNPYYFVEEIGLHSRYCILSTRILPPRKTKDAIAYLSSEREYQDDPTNYWFFSEAGIRRMLDRCSWDVLASRITGDASDSTDTRFFCLLESRIARSRPTLRLIDGWHYIENRAWRWSRRNFGVVVENSAGARRFDFRFRVTEDLLKLSGSVGVRCTLNGADLGAETFTVAGLHTYSRAIEPAPRRAEIRVSLSHTFSDGERDLGVVVRLPPETIVDEDCGFQLYS